MDEKIINKFNNLKYLLEENVLGLKNSDENTKEEFNNKINGIIEKSD